MNKGLYGFPQGRGLQTGLFSFPRDEFGDVFQGRVPPVSDFAAWYDISDVASLTVVSDEITEWRDKSANARHANLLYDDEPGYGGSFDRKIGQVVIADFQNSPEEGLGTTCPVGSDVSWFVVGVPDDVSTYQVLLGTRGNAVGWEMGVNSDSFIFGKSGDGFTTSGAIAPVAGRPFAYGITYEGTTKNFAINNSRNTKAVARADGTGDLLIGNNGATGFNQSWNGGIAEVIAYGRVLDSEEVNNTMDYLMNKWDIA